MRELEAREFAFGGVRALIVEERRLNAPGVRLTKEAFFFIYSMT